MRRLLSSVLLMGTVTAFAQNSDEDVPKAIPFALDTTVPAAKMLNNEMARQLGFNLAIVDSTTPRTVLSVYKTTGPEGLRIEFKYRSAEDENGQTIPGQYVVQYERILATDATMAGVFNYIFHTTLQPNQLRAVISTGTPMKYKGGMSTYMLDEADMRPGYWELTFLR